MITVTNQQALTVGTAAYTAADVVGGLITFPVGIKHGIIRSLLITDAAAQSEPFTLYLYNAEPSTIADDANFAPTIADLNKLITTVTIGTADWTETNSLDWCVFGGHEDTAMEQYFEATDGNLYAYLVAGDTPDFAAADDVTVTITVQDIY